MSLQGNPINLLLVEDDEIDIKTIQRSLSELKLLNPLIVARDGIEGLEHLRGENGKDKVEGPRVVLLDLNMPRMGGLEFLEEVRKDPDLHSTVIFVLTTSDADQDIVSAYEKNVAGYIVKSDSTASFVEAIRLIDFYWTIVKLP